MKKKIVLVTGGARSGKSGFALKLSEAMTGKKFFIATAEPLDDEMTGRIARHRRERSSIWETVEEPKDPASRIKGIKEGVVLLDCLTLWVSNLLCSGLGEKAALDEVEGLVSACVSTGASVVVVSNEVGLGVTPENTLSRRFVDVSGLMNQRFAQVSDEAYFVAAGMPLKVK